MLPLSISEWKGVQFTSVKFHGDCLIKYVSHVNTFYGRILQISLGFVKIQGKQQEKSKDL